MLVFLPVFMLEGLSGAFFRPLATAYVLAILASLLVALTITPALSLLMLPKHLDAKESRLVTALKDWYRRTLPRLIDRPRRRRRRLGRADGRHARVRAAAWRRVSPELSRVRLPDALGREAGQLNRGDAAHHRAREQGAARHPWRAKLRIAYRPCRGGGRSRRAELHRALDQPRSQRRLRGDGREGPGGRRRLSGPVSRSADLPPRAHQGGA